ncbi:hypothetical protein IJG72_06155 [bacterium]|nr:hypothetical protein [bacterium]
MPDVSSINPVTPKATGTQTQKPEQQTETTNEPIITGSRGNESAGLRIEKDNNGAIAKTQENVDAFRDVLENGTEEEQEQAARAACDDLMRSQSCDISLPPLFQPYEIENMRRSYGGYPGCYSPGNLQISADLVSAPLAYATGLSMIGLAYPYGGSSSYGSIFGGAAMSLAGVFMGAVAADKMARSISVSYTPSSAYGSYQCQTPYGCGRQDNSSQSNGRTDTGNHIRDINDPKMVKKAAELYDEIADGNYNKSQRLMKEIPDKDFPALCETFRLKTGTTLIKHVDNSFSDFLAGNKQQENEKVILDKLLKVAKTKPNYEDFNNSYLPTFESRLEKSYEGRWTENEDKRLSCYEELMNFLRSN